MLPHDDRSTGRELGDGVSRDDPIIGNRGNRLVTFGKSTARPRVVPPFHESLPT